MSEIIQANCSLSKTSGETDLGRNVRTQDNSPQDNLPHIKLTLKQLAPDSETISPHVVILHNVLKYAGKIVNILKFYSPQLDINLADRCITYFRANHLSAVSFEDNPLLHQSILFSICVGDNWSAKMYSHNRVCCAVLLVKHLHTSIHHEVKGLMKGTPSIYPPLTSLGQGRVHI